MWYNAIFCYPGESKNCYTIHGKLKIYGYFQRMMRVQKKIQKKNYVDLEHYAFYLSK